MKCIECNKEMKLVGSEDFYLSDDSDATSCIHEYDCPKCGIKIFYNMSIDNNGIQKLYIPDNLKPSIKQHEFADFICKLMPELKYIRQSCYTKRQLSKFITKYKDTAFKANKEKQESASKKVAKSIKRNVKKKNKESLNKEK